jgi:acyl carrier protein
MKTEIDPTISIGERLQLCLPRISLSGRPETRIADLGLDSMDVVELLCAIHEEFSVRLTETDFHSQQTIGGLLRAIADQTNSSSNDPRP